jgi:hypothetical protein
METKKHPSLTAYTVTTSDGSFYTTNMAAGITLEQARAYFLGQWFEQADEKTMLQAVAVESYVPGTPTGGPAGSRPIPTASASMTICDG